MNERREGEERDGRKLGETFLKKSSLTLSKNFNLKTSIHWGDSCGNSVSF